MRKNIKKINNQFVFILFLVGFLFSLFAISNKQCDNSELTQSMKDLIVDSCVKIEIGEGSGSGVIVNNDGDEIKILTCNHLFMAPDTITSPPTTQPYLSRLINVSIYKNGQMFYSRLSASLVSNNPKMDIALLSVRIKDKSIKTANLIPGDLILDIRRFDNVFSVGFPGPTTQTYVSNGIIANNNVRGLYWSCNTPIVPGYSGGGVFTIIGKEIYLIGLNNQIGFMGGNIYECNMDFISPIVIHHFLDNLCKD